MLGTMSGEVPTLRPFTNTRAPPGLVSTEIDPGTATGFLPGAAGDPAGGGALFGAGRLVFGAADGTDWRSRVREKAIRALGSSGLSVTTLSCDA